MGIKELGEGLEARLAHLIDEHDLPGASVAISDGETTVTAAAGVLSRKTGVEATTDSIFQAGSITKLFTSTLVMQLVDDGLLDIDAPVQRYLPNFRVADAEVSKAVTARHLLTHTSGIDGDSFTDTGRGDEAVERYVAGMAELEQITALGEVMSYCNSGFVLLGRLVEVLREMPFHTAMRTHLLEPLGITDVAVLPEEALLFRAATGHIPGPDGELMQAPVWNIPASIAPAGALLTITASGLLTFGRMCLNDGKGVDGKQVVSPAALKLMQTRQVEIPEKDLVGGGVGLGFLFYNYSGPLTFGHDGGTIGQNAYLRLVPDRGIAVSLMVNAAAMGLFRALVGDFLDHAAGVQIPPLPTPPAAGDSVEVDPARFVGTYERSGVRELVEESEGSLYMTTIPTGPLAAMTISKPEPTRLVAINPTTLITAEPEPRLKVHLPYAFLGVDVGPATHIHSGGRATPRRS